MTDRKKIILVGAAVLGVAVAIIFAASMGDRSRLAEELPMDDQLTDPVVREFEGEIVCLPHKQTSGPVTLECAFGLRTAGGVHFGLRNLFTGAPDPDLTTGSHIRVFGAMEAPPSDEVYDIHGIIDVRSVERS